MPEPETTERTEQHIVLSISDAIAEETGYTEICVREVLEASSLLPAVRSLILNEIAEKLEREAGQAPRVYSTLAQGMRDAAETVRSWVDLDEGEDRHG